MVSEIRRYALVTLRTNKFRSIEEDVKIVKNYLPSNYKVVGIVKNEVWDDYFEAVALIEGRDEHGWTLDNYVIPRLGSGMYACKEVDLTHPLVGNLPAFVEERK